jgi:hypothetical protein
MPLLDDRRRRGGARHKVPKASYRGGGDRKLRSKTKLFLGMALTVSLVLAFAVGFTAAGGEANSHIKVGEVEKEIALMTPGGDVWGIAKIEVNTFVIPGEPGGIWPYHELELEISTTNVPATDMVFEAWLVDDPGTGYKLSLGVFVSHTTGSELELEGNLVHLVFNGAPYDKIVITLEPKHDSDPTPSGVVLAAASIL